MKARLLIFLCFLSVEVFALSEYSFSFNTYNNKDGLSQNTVRTMIQDDNGFIWLGTLNGLNRFDGNEFKVWLPKHGKETILSDSRIRAIKKDDYGYIWIQTNIDNINCFDTKVAKFIEYHPTSNKHGHLMVTETGNVWLWGVTSGCLQVVHKENGLESTYFGEELLGTNKVNFVLKAKDGVVWIGTDHKLFSYDEKKLTVRGEGENYGFGIETKSYLSFFTSKGKVLVYDKNTKQQIKAKELNTAKYSKINNIVLLTEDRILITTDCCIYVFDPSTLEQDNAGKLFNKKQLNDAHTYLDNKHNLWVYNKSGSLWQFDKKTGLFNEYKLIPPSILSFIDLERFCIYHDSRNIIWVSTYGNGLFAIDADTKEMEHFVAKENRYGGLKTNFLLSVIEDNTGEVWVGTEYAGVSKISISKYKNNLFLPGGEGGLENDKIIRLIHEDRRNNIWIGTKKGNLFIFDKNFKLLKKHHITGGIPYTCMEDLKGNIWIGTKGNGILFFKEAQYKQYTQFSLPTSAVSSQTSNNIYAICQDSQGRVWLGAFGNGLLVASEKNGAISFQKIETISQEQKRIRTVVQDRFGLIWIGGNNGAMVFNPDELLKDSTKFQSFQFNNNDAGSLDNNEVKVIYEDSKGHIWLGTSGGGVNLAVRNEQSGEIYFKHFTTEEGLINDVVQGMQEDNHGALWISTESGVSKLDIGTLRFENYNFSSDWQGDLFCEAASCKLSNGKILLGSYNGMYILNPKSMVEEVNTPSVIFTGLELNGNRVTPISTDSPLEKAIYNTSGIKLKYGQNSFNIQFATLHYRNPQTNSFSYILEGYERSWNPVTRHNWATYRNVPSGKYIFKVKGRNSLGIWNKEPTTLHITIVPPFWRSPLAILGYMVFLITGLVTAAITIIKINRLNTAVKIEQQLTEFKLRFFTNISHEFRSPLTLIRGGVETLLSNGAKDEESLKQLNLLGKSTRRLLRLTDQLLAFRQLQNNKLSLNPEQTEVVSFTKEIFSAFEELAIKHHIQYSFTTNTKEINMLLDQGNMDKVVHNLLSNAFKHTPNEGKIELELNVDNSSNLLELTVSDSGPGIPKDKTNQLFVRFSHINPKVAGMGIGLHLSAELVKLQKGTIAYKESRYGGACFILKIPLLTLGVKSVRKKTESQYNRENINIELLDIPESSFLNDIDPKYVNSYKLLIIEDDEEIREYLKSQLSKYYMVFDAPNGKAGLETCIEKQPDLIICDVMMPEMDGYEVTRRIKTEFQTSHIPIVLLTAYASDSHKLRGIEAGADAYVTKPFSTKYLMMRVVKLIEQRDKLRQKFTKEPGLNNLPVYIVDKDNEFIKTMQVVVEENIKNANFSVDDFASSFKMGRTVFFKKIKGLTGYTPNEYIRVARMKKAAELLGKTELNVSEVAFEIGMNNPFYFSSCFKKQFGVSPSEYAKNGGKPK